jgi:hypothetical protein
MSCLGICVYLKGYGTSQSQCFNILFKGDLHDYIIESQALNFVD